MSLYLDASILVSLYVAEGRSREAEAALLRHGCVVSDFAASEFSSGIARRFRMGEISDADAAGIFSTFDAWLPGAARLENLAPDDISTANRWVRRLDLALRTPDAINLAIASRIGATLFTFDVKMAGAARALGLPVLG